jgi:serine/threonine-protein kinase RsbW
VTVRVHDDGGGLHPRADSPGMGLGLPLIAQVADELEIGPAEGGRGTQVAMTFGYDTPALH